MKGFNNSDNVGSGEWNDDSKMILFSFNYLGSLFGFGFVVGQYVFLEFWDSSPLFLLQVARIYIYICVNVNIWCLKGW